VFPTTVLEGRGVLPGEGAKYLAKNDEITCGICTRGRNFIRPNRKENFMHPQQK